jgi:hypothetical protein
MNGRIWRTRPMSRIRCADGADEMNFRAVELRSVIIQSLRNTQTARKELLPLTTNLSTAAALASRSSCASSFERDSGNSGETKSAI